ncbi:MAG: binding-protein-dependent transport system inner rane component, partial [Hyphomicrobiales bacterium]|nr:binding-protein-dependent transport system inner rane component [Hyphomicrobiales bacterium]
VIDKPLYEHDHVFTLKNFSNLFSDARFYAALWNTLILGVIGTLLSTSLGFVAALLLDRLEHPFQRTLKIMFLSPIFLSALILSFAWSMMYGPSSFVALWLQGTLGFGLPDLYTLGGISVLAGVSSAPVSYLYFSSAMVNIPNTLEQAARASGATQLQTIRTIVLPLLMPSLLYCLLLNFVLKMDLLAVPLVLGGPARIEVLATYLYDKGVLSGKVDYGLVSATAIVMLLLVQGFIFLQKFVLGDKRKYNTVGGRGGRRSLLKTGRWGWLIAIGIVAYCLVTSVLPCLYLILRAFTSFLSPYMSIMDVLTLDNFKVVLGYDAYVKSIYNTIIISGVGGAFAVVLTFFGTILAYRSPKFLQGFTEQTAFIPRAIPGLVVGIGIFYATILLPGAGLLQGTLAILVIAYIIRYFPTGFAALSPPFLQVAEDMEKAVRVAGGSQFRSYMAVTLPILRPALLACFLIYFVQFFKEYAAASFLFGPDTAVVGTTMLQLNVMGNYGPVAALSAITIALTLPVAIFIYGKRTA